MWFLNLFESLRSNCVSDPNKSFLSRRVRKLGLLVFASQPPKQSANVHFSIRPCPLAKDCTCSVHEVSNVALCSSLDFVFSLCIPLVPVSQIRDPISRVDASVSWLCHFGERPFSLCLCLGCCVSCVINTSFFVAVSPCQEIGTCLSGRQWTQGSISAQHAYERSALGYWPE